MDNNSSVVNKIKKNNKRVFKILLFAISILIVSVFSLIQFMQYKKDSIIVYRVYTSENGWSKWYRNNQVAGDKGNIILAIEIKTNLKETGYVFYNTLSDELSFNDNDEYDGLTSGDKRYPLYAIRMFLTDNLYKNYKIYYRTHNKSDNWLGWSSNKEVSGNKNVGMDQIQIKLIEINEEFNYEPNKTHRNFMEDNYE